MICELDAAECPAAAHRTVAVNGICWLRSCSSSIVRVTKSGIRWALSTVDATRGHRQSARQTDEIFSAIVRPLKSVVLNDAELGRSAHPGDRAGLRSYS